jgi:hypothetical protein
MKMSGHISVYNRISTRRFRCRPQTHPQPFRDGKHNGVAGYSLFTIAQEENDYTIVARLDAPGSARRNPKSREKTKVSGTIFWPDQDREGVRNHLSERPAARSAQMVPAPFSACGNAPSAKGSL